MKRQLQHVTISTFGGRRAPCASGYGAVSPAGEDAVPPDEELLAALDGLGLHTVDEADRVPRVDRAYDRAFDVRFVHCIAATRA